MDMFTKTIMFTKKELIHLKELSLCWSDPNCEECSIIRHKIDKMIEGHPDKTEETINGHPVTVENISHPAQNKDIHTDRLYRGK